MSGHQSAEEAQLASCQVSPSPQIYGNFSPFSTPLQAYVRQHNVQQLVKDAIVSLCIHKPDNPVLFLRDHFDRLAAEQQRQQFSQVGQGSFSFFLFSSSLRPNQQQANQIGPL